MHGLIMDLPLMISSAIQHAAAYHGGTEIVARGVDGAIHRYTYAEAHRRTKRAAALFLSPSSRLPPSPCVTR